MSEDDVHTVALTYREIDMVIDCMILSLRRWPSATTSELIDLIDRLYAEKCKWTLPRGKP